MPTPREVIEVHIAWGDALVHASQIPAGSRFVLGEGGDFAVADAALAGAHRWAVIANGELHSPHWEAPAPVTSEARELVFGPLRVRARRVPRPAAPPRGPWMDRASLVAVLVAGLVVGVGAAAVATIPRGGSTLPFALRQANARWTHLFPRRGVAGSSVFEAGQGVSRRADRTPERARERPAAGRPRTTSPRAAQAASRLSVPRTSDLPDSRVLSALHTASVHWTGGSSDAWNLQILERRHEPGRGGGGIGFGTLTLGTVGRGAGGDGSGTIPLGPEREPGSWSIGHGCCGRSGSGYGRGAGQFRGRQSGAPRVRAQAATVRGGLARDVVRRVIRRHRAEVRHCYREALRTRPELRGRLEIQLVIDQSGTVSSGAVVESTVGDASLANCVLAAGRRWTFPAPESGGVVVVRYPFVFDVP